MNISKNLLVKTGPLLSYCFSQSIKSDMKVVPKIQRLLVKSGDVDVKLAYPYIDRYHQQEKNIDQHLIPFLEDVTKILPSSKVETFKAVKIPLLASTTFPYVKTLEELVIGAKWLSFLFYHDDFFENNKSSDQTEKIHKEIYFYLNGLIEQNSQFDFSVKHQCEFLKDEEQKYITKMVKILESIFNDFPESVKSNEKKIFLSEIVNYFRGTEEEIRMKERLNLNVDQEELENI